MITHHNTQEVNCKFTCKASSYHFKYYSKLYKSFNKIVAVATVAKCLKQTKQKPALYVLFMFYIKNLTYLNFFLLTQVAFRLMKETSEATILNACSFYTFLYWLTNLAIVIISLIGKLYFFSSNKHVCLNMYHFVPLMQ